MQVTLVKELAPIVDGRGGGKPDMAMAGGSNQEWGRENVIRRRMFVSPSLIKKKANKKEKKKTTFS